MQWVISSIDTHQQKQYCSDIQSQSVLLLNGFETTNVIHHTTDTNTQLHHSIDTPPTHIHVTHTHTNTTRHAKRLLTRKYNWILPLSETSPMDKHKHLHTPTQTALFGHAQPSFMISRMIQRYTTRQTPTHNLRHCHISDKASPYLPYLYTTLQVSLQTVAAIHNHIPTKPSRQKLLPGKE